LQKEREITEYWDKISKKMKRRYFLCCIVFRKDKFKLAFKHDLKSSFPKDDREKIYKCARKNKLEVCFEENLPDKSVYYFKKKEKK
jgi:hypothetical protein